VPVGAVISSGGLLTAGTYVTSISGTTWNLSAPSIGAGATQALTVTLQPFVAISGNYDYDSGTSVDAQYGGPVP
jgi:hypothetical protein